MYSFVCNFSKLEVITHYKAKNQDTVKTNLSEHAHTIDSIKLEKMRFQSDETVSEMGLLHLSKMCLIWQPIDEKVLWQKVLYRKIGESKTSGTQQLSQARIIERIISMAKVMHGLHMVGHRVVVLMF